jgi:alpha-beta hydrolase superfamily lysophospholipase
MAILEVEDPVAASPYFFGVNGASCLGWFHPAKTPRSGMGVVMCRAIGYESMCAYGAYTQAAEQLALAGFDVLRFDYPGTGDSTGDDSQPDRLQSWTDSIVGATQQLEKLSGCSVFCLFGLRLGANLAAHAASQLGGVARLILWAPCATGRAFARELRAAALTRERSLDEKNGPVSGDIESLGFMYTAQTMADLDALPGLPADGPLAPRVLILDRDDRPSAKSLLATLQSRGADTTCALAPGYAAMMNEPRETHLDALTMAQLKDWLLSDLMGVSPDPLPLTLANADQARPRQQQFGGLRETAVSFGAVSVGAAPKLFGILTEPDPGQEPPGCSDTAILMLNVAGNYRIGPNRIYVHIARELARTGCRALRFDLAGLGDSRHAEGFQAAHLYSKDSTPEVRAAVDFLSAQGCKKFYLLGICSGSFVAFQAALADTRVTGQILMNSRLLEWREANPDGTWQDAMLQSYKSVAFYRRHLLDWRVYKRILQGDVDVAGIANRVRVLIGARLSRALAATFRKNSFVHGPLHKVQQLSGRGTDTLLIVNADDDGRDYLEFHFGAGGKYLQDDCRFQMFFIANSDHTFSDQHGQKSVISKLKDYLGVHDLIGSECFQPALAVTKSTLELSPSSGLV